MAVLVVDELAISGESLTADLRQAGYEVLECSSVTGACASIRTFNKYVRIEVVALGLQPSGSDVAQYESASTRITATLRSAGQLPPVFVFLPLSETLQPFVSLAVKLGAGMIPRRTSQDLQPKLRELSTELYPRILGFHTCADAVCTDGEIEEICVESPKTGILQVPLSRAPRYYLDFLGRYVSWKRPKTAEQIVNHMLELDLYREALGPELITKRAFITNFSRIAKALRSIPLHVDPVHIAYPGKQTVYAIRCRYVAIHGEAGSAGWQLAS